MTEIRDFTDGEYGMTFTEIDLVKDEFINHFTIKIADGKLRALYMINNIKEKYPANLGEPQMIMDFVDSDWSIFDDHPLTFPQARKLAEELGFKPTF